MIGDSEGAPGDFLDANGVLFLGLSDSCEVVFILKRHCQVVHLRFLFFLSVCYISIKSLVKECVQQ